MAKRKKAKRPRPQPAEPAETTASAVTADDQARAKAKVKAAGKEEAPPAPWGSFPLMELCVLAGLILIVIGAITGNAKQLAIGLGLGSLGGLELSIREHFAGYRSHTTLLAGVVFMFATGITFFLLEFVLWLCLVAGIVLAAGAWVLFRKAFEKASGGLSYKLR